MMPHIVWSVSHAPGKCLEIYAAELVHGVLEQRLAQTHAHGGAAFADAPHPPGRHAELLGERPDRHGALGRARHHGAAMRFAEQQLLSRESQPVSREIDVETEARLVIRPSHRDFREGDSEAALRAVMRRAEQPPLGRRDQTVHQATRDAKVYLW